MRSILIVTLLAPAILFPLRLAGAEAGDDGRQPRTFLPPRGTWTEYRMQAGLNTSFGGRNAGRFERDPAAELIQRRLILILPVEGEEAVLLISNQLSPGEPECEALVLLRLAGSAAEPLECPVELDLRGFDFRSHLLASLEGPELRPGIQWTAAERQPRWTAFSGMFEYLVERHPPPAGGALVVRCRRTGPVQRFLPSGREMMDITACRREIVFHEGTGRLLSYLVEEESSPREGARREVNTTSRRTVEIAEIAHRPLTERELGSLKREIDLLGPAATAGPDSADETLAALDAYHQGFPEGVLRAGAQALRKAFEERSRRVAADRKREEDLQAALSGRGPAPELTVRDLEGRAVSLSEFKGKPVLLSFGDLSTPAGRAEARFLGQWQEKYGERGLVVISVLDHRPRPQEAAELRERGVRHILYEERGRGEAEAGSLRFGVSRRPMEFYIDRRGELVLRRQGFLTATAGLREEKIVELLLEGKP